MGFTRALPARGIHYLGAVTQCDDCGISFSMSPTAEGGGKAVKETEDDHLAVCPGPPDTGRATRTAAAEPGAVTRLHDIVDLEKYVEAQIEDKAREYAAELLSEELARLRAEVADKFSDDHEDMREWRLSGDRGRRLLGRRRKPRQRELDLYTTGALDAMANTLQELHWAARAAK